MGGRTGERKKVWGVWGVWGNRDTKGTYDFLNTKAIHPTSYFVHPVRTYALKRKINILVP